MQLVQRVITETNHSVASVFNSAVQDEAKKNIIDMKLIKTGRLLNSIRVHSDVVTMYNSNNLIDAEDYGKFLEFGTPKIPVRGFCRRALDKIRLEFTITPKYQIPIVRSIQRNQGWHINDKI